MKVRSRQKHCVNFYTISNEYTVDRGKLDWGKMARLRLNCKTKQMK